MGELWQFEQPIPDSVLEICIAAVAKHMEFLIRNAHDTDGIRCVQGVIEMFSPCLRIEVFRIRVQWSSFGSFDAWIADTKAGLMSAHGWVVLVYDYAEGKLFNNLIRTEHDVGLFANVHAMAAIDAWEHAYFFDYQTKKADYVSNVLSGLNWDVLNGRFQQVIGHKG